MDLFRRELKFHIDQNKADAICAYLGSYCQLDKHSALAADGYYTINSLYLDTPQMTLLEHKRKGLADRFSVRIRTYGEEPKTFPAFLEIKRNVNGMVAKKRVTLSRPETLEFIRSGGASECNPDLEQRFFPAICYQIWKLGLEPRIMTQYRRLAFFGLDEPYTRVTFDRSLRCYPETDFRIFPNLAAYANYDSTDIYNSPQSSIVLELKCELKLPHWMRELVRRFELKHSTFSKFDSSYTFTSEKRALLGV